MAKEVIDFEATMAGTENKIVVAKEEPAAPKKEEEVKDEQEEEQDDEQEKEDKDEEEEKDDQEEESDDKDEEEEDKKDDKSDQDDEDETDDDEEEDDEKEEPKADSKKEKEAVAPVDEDEIIAKSLTDFGIKNKEELVETLQGVDALIKAYEEEKKKPKEPVFESEAAKKAYEFLIKSGYDPERFNEGIMTHAKLISMDVSKADPKSLLEEQFVLEHPDLTREEAHFKFEKNYSRKFVIDKSKYDDDTEYEEAKKEAEVDLKIAVNRAKEYLTKKQEEYKAPAKKSEEKADNKVAPEVESGIKKTLSGFDEFLDGFDTLIFGEDPETEFKFKVPQKYLKQIQEAGKKYLSRPDIYNEKGQIPDHDPEQYTIKLAFALMGEEIVKSALKHVDRVAAIKKADKLAEKKPDRKGGKLSGDAGELDFLAQAELIVKQRKGK